MRAPDPTRGGGSGARAEESVARARQRHERPAGRTAREAGPAGDAGSAERWRSLFARRLRSHLAAPVRVEITDNTYTMISFSRRAGAYCVRLHHMFLTAPPPVVETLAGYIRGDDRRASAFLDDFIHDHRRLIRHVPPVQRQRRLPLRSAGRVHDLAGILAEVCAGFFPRERGHVAIAWAPTPRVALPRSSIKLGSYSADTQIIRIHPALDQTAVPRFFVKWIVFHEMLHHEFREALKARRGRIHTEEFERRERDFPGYREALRWERHHLDLLLWWSPPVTVPGFARASRRVRSA